MNILEEKHIKELRDDVKTKGDLDRFFLKNQIEKTEDKVAILKEATHETESYYSGGSDEMSIEDRYKDDETIFLRGKWRLFR